MIRLAGAQIPNGVDIQINKKEIFKALDWAKENEVDELLTPEGSLSGYETEWQRKMPELHEALFEVQEHQKKCGVGLHLGTNFQESEYTGFVFRNEIRHYAKDGVLNGITKKTFTLDTEGVLARNSKKDIVVGVPLGGMQDVHAMGMVCNDMWGAHNRDEPSIQGYVNDLLKWRSEIQLIFHATNGRKVNADDMMYKVYGDYHNSVLRFNAVFSYPILTVDSCSSWQWDGDEEWVDKFPTSSQSGFVDYSGWHTDIPRYGRQYFYHDLDPDLRLDKINDQNKKIQAH